MKQYEKHKTARRGMTLVELLVSVVVLSILMLIFGQILSSAQRVVNKSIGIMRANSAATAIENMIRADLSSLSQAGFIYIKDDGSFDIFYTVIPAVAHSATGFPDDTGAIIGYGGCPASGLDAGQTMIWRNNLILSNTRLPVDSDSLDKFYWTNSSTGRTYGHFDDIASGSVADLESIIAILQTSTYTPASLASPPTTLTDVQKLWKNLATGCTSFNILFADGTRSGAELVWYSETSTWLKNDPRKNTAGTRNWPTAIRFVFELTGDAMSKDFAGIKYEIVVATPFVKG